MTTRPRAWISWSSGKDSALALHETLTAGELDVVGLLTTINSTADRVAMHAVRRTLLEAQADALGLPLHVVDLPWPCANSVYEDRMSAAVATAVAAGVTHMVFGDLYLEDVRGYRETALAGSGIRPVFPLWGRPTAELARQVIDLGIRAVITCVDPKQVPAALCGRAFDPGLLSELPPDSDPCGENGEFHTFVFDSPDFRSALATRPGEIVERDGFVFADLLPC